MLATSCQQGHLDVVRLLVHSYNADAKDCAIHSDEFPVVSGLPLYAAAEAGMKMHLNTLYYLFLLFIFIICTVISKTIQHLCPENTKKYLWVLLEVFSSSVKIK